MRQAELSAAITKRKCRLIIAIGPEAARFAWSDRSPQGVPRIYAMVRDPNKTIGAETSACGISLDIPVFEQLSAITLGHPAVRRLGLLFDPLNNRRLYSEISTEAARAGLTIVPLEVSAQREIQTVLKKNWRRMDALWIVPDRTTILSRRLVEYVIRRSIYQRVPVIGYDRFFYERGASLSFVIDFREMGLQCGRKAVRLLNGGPCDQTPPEFELWVNTRVMEKLGVSGPHRMVPPLRQGP